MAEQSVTDKLKSGLLGLGRGFTADLVGGPVDLVETILNLGIAGVGFAGHKTGLLKEPLPLLKGSVGGSDWFAKGTPLEDDGSTAYSVGRVGAAVAPMVRPTAQALAPKVGEIAEEYADKMLRAQAISPGGKDSLITQHQMTLPKATGENRNKGPLRELYSPSIGITDIEGPNPIITNFGSYSNGSLWLVPRLGAFSPRDPNATLINRDAYTPRFSQYQGKAVDFAKLKQKQLIDTPATGRKIVELPNMDLVRGRLQDRGLAGPLPWPRGGALEEKHDPGEGHRASILMSPRFQSFEHYENSPYGAPLLLKDEPYSSDGQLSRIIYAMGPRLQGATGAAEILNRAKLRVQELSTRLKTAGEANELDELRDALEQLRRQPSEYGELKVHGPVPINKERFAGAVMQPEAYGAGDLYKAQRELQDAWGIPVVIQEDSSRKLRGEVMRDLQNSVAPYKAGVKGRLLSGLAGRPVEASLLPVGPKLPDYAVTEPNQYGIVHSPDWSALSNPENPLFFSEIPNIKASSDSDWFGGELAGAMLGGSKLPDWHFDNLSSEASSAFTPENAESAKVALTSALADYAKMEAWAKLNPGEQIPSELIQKAYKNQQNLIKDYGGQSLKAFNELAHWIQFFIDPKQTKVPELPYFFAYGKEHVDKYGANPAPGADDWVPEPPVKMPKAPITEFKTALEPAPKPKAPILKFEHPDYVQYANPPLKTFGAMSDTEVANLLSGPPPSAEAAKKLFPGIPSPEWAFQDLQVIAKADFEGKKPNFTQGWLPFFSDWEYFKQQALAVKGAAEGAGLKMGPFDVTAPGLDEEAVANMKQFNKEFFGIE